MGLMDILNGMQHGPRGKRDPNAKGMSKVTMALLALLAYKAYQKMTEGGATPAPDQRPTRQPEGGRAPEGAPPPRLDRDTREAGSSGGLGDLLKGPLGDLLGGGAGPSRSPGGRAASAASGGGLEDLLKGGLGGLLAGGAAGTVLSGGLDNLLKGLKQNGLGDVADSWVGRGPNKEISNNDLAKSVGLDDIDALAHRSGLSREELLSGMSEQLPGLVDQLTPEGRMPTEDESARWV